MSLSDEYKQLRDEIGRNSQITQAVFVANVAVTAALLGYGLNAKVGTVFLAPFAILIPSLFFIASQLESSTSIAAYIVVFLEAELDELNWETRWLALRQRGLLPARRKYTMALSGIYGLLGVVCILLAFQYWPYRITLFVIVAVLVILIFAWGIRILVRTFSLEMVRAYLDAWQQLKSDADR